MFAKTLLSDLAVLLNRLPEHSSLPASVAIYEAISVVAIWWLLPSDLLGLTLVSPSNDRFAYVYSIK